MSDRRYKTPLTNLYGSDGHSLAHVVVQTFEPIDQLGTIETVNYRSEQVALAMARLLEILHERGILSLAEVREVIDTSYDIEECEPG